MKLSTLVARKVTLFCLMMFSGMALQQLHAEANYVYHTRSMSDPMPGCNSTPYVSNFNPGLGDAVTLAFKVEFQFYTNTAALYYTTDGSNPSGAFGIASGTTQVVLANFDCTFNNGFGGIVDVWKATIPGQSACKTVKYIMSAWHSGGGGEIFANGPGSPCNCGTPTYTSDLATVFSYDVANLNMSVSTVIRDVKCYGGASGKIKVTPSGGAGPYSFNWNTGATGNVITGLSADSYQVTMTDQAGCSLVSEVDVNEPPSPLVIDDISLSFVLEGYSATILASGGNPGYLYALKGVTGLQSNSNFVIPFGSEGLYTFKVRDLNGTGCTASTTQFISKGTSLLTVPEDGASLKVYNATAAFPNPTSGEFTIRFELDEAQPLDIIMTDLLGKIVLSTSMEASKGENTLRLDATDYPAGTYQVSILGMDELMTLPLVKKD